MVKKTKKPTAVVRTSTKKSNRTAKKPIARIKKDVVQKTANRPVAKSAKHPARMLQKETATVVTIVEGKNGCVICGWHEFEDEHCCVCGTKKGHVHKPYKGM